MISKSFREFTWRGKAHMALTAAAAVLLGMAPGMVHEAAAGPIPSSFASSDTIPVTSLRLFQSRLLFSPEYLRRALDPLTRPAGAVSEAADPAAAAIEAFARRYGISTALARQIHDSAVAEGLDPELGFRLVRVESVFRAAARGPGGALGLTQLMPSTARAIDRTLRTEAQILDPVTNLRTGFRYLRGMIDRYNGNVTLGVLAYNRGEGAVDRAIRAGSSPENGYSTKVLGREGNRYSGTGVLPRR